MVLKLIGQRRLKAKYDEHHPILSSVSLSFQNRERDTSNIESEALMQIFCSLDCLHAAALGDASKAKRIPPTHPVAKKQKGYPQPIQWRLQKHQRQRETILLQTFAFASAGDTSKALAGMLVSYLIMHQKDA